MNKFNRCFFCFVFARQCKVSPSFFTVSGYKYLLGGSIGWSYCICKYLFLIWYKNLLEKTVKLGLTHSLPISIQATVWWDKAFHVDESLAQLQLHFCNTELFIAFLHRECCRFFGDEGMTPKVFFTKVAPFGLLWILTNYLYLQALRKINTTDVSALFCCNKAFVFLLSWIVLRDRFMGVRVSFSWCVDFWHPNTRDNVFVSTDYWKNGKLHFFFFLKFSFFYWCHFVM